MSEGQEKTRREGGCLCGAVRYEIRGELRQVIACHCRQCQKSHGNFAAYTKVPLEGFTLTAQEGLKWYRSSETARRGFCRHCGSSLFWERLDVGDLSGDLSVAAGSIDPPSGLVTICHIFTADKGDYYEIADGLEQLSAGQGAAKPV